MSGFDCEITLDSGVTVKYWRIGQIVLDPGQPVKAQIHSYLDREAYDQGRSPVTSATLQLGNIDNLNNLVEDIYNLIIKGIRSDPNLPFKNKEEEGVCEPCGS